MKDEAQQVCPYCDWTFTVTRRHVSERVLPYCSHGCRLAVQAAPSNKGQNMVTLDHASEIAQPVAEVEPTNAVQRAQSQFAWALRNLMSFDRVTRDCVCLRYLHETGSDCNVAHSYESIGRRYGISPQAVEKKIRNAIRAWPAIAWMLQTKKSRQKREGQR